MTALAENTSRTRQVDTNIRAYPVGAAEHIYAGSYVGIDPAGYLKTFEPCDMFVGISYEEFDNSDGAAGAANPGNGETRCRVHVEGDFELTLASIAKTDRGKPVYATDDNALSLTGHPDAFVGTILHYESSTTGVIRLRKPFEKAPVDGSSIDLFADFAQFSMVDQAETAWLFPNGFKTYGVGAGLTAAATGFTVDDAIGELEMLLDNDSEAEGLAFETQQVFNITKGITFEMLGRNKTASASATGDLDFGLMGLAAGITTTERADMHVATAGLLSCLFHLDCDALDIFGYSDDNASPIAVTDTLINNSLTVNKLHRINCRVGGACELWIDNVHVLTTTLFSVGAAGLLAGICNIEKDATTDVPEIRIRRFRTAGAIA